MRNVLVGAVESTLVALRVLAERGAPPALLVTLPPDRAGRHSDWVDLRPEAERLGVPVLETVDVNEADVLARIRAVAAEHIFVVGWSQICRAEFLAAPRAGVIGYHPAPLPEHRGRAVLPWTILLGATTTGSTLFWMDDGVDSGDILAQEVFAVAPDETARSLYDKHLAALARLLGGTVSALVDGRAARVPQDHARATFCARRRPDDGVIDWQAPAVAVWTLVRAVGDPYPGAFTFHRGRRLTVWSARHHGPAPYVGLAGQVQMVTADGVLVRCGDGNHVVLRDVEPAGGARCPAAAVLRVHDRLGVDWTGLAERAGGASS